jgi:16S rRNA (guanine(527)-N(7))-methyltransferase RsmG
MPDQSSLAVMAEESGVSLAPEQLHRLWKYHLLIRRYNPELNLTRVHSFRNMVLKLYIDSILPGQIIQLPSPLMDLGTGAGMPGIPLKIVNPEIEILLAEGRQRRVEFLRIAMQELDLQGLEIVGRGIGPDFDRPVAGVITRAVENMAETLKRISGCLDKGGRAIFMKGPRCDPEINEVLEDMGDRYRLVKTWEYDIPHTPHQRRLVVFERLDEPPRTMKAKAMKRHSSHVIESDQNEIFKDIKKLLTSRGIKKQNRALVSGSKPIDEILKSHPRHCLAWISRGSQHAPPAGAPEAMSWYQMAPALFRTLDSFGTNAPLLLIRTEEIPVWNPSDGFPTGCSLLIPFQDPENVGAVIRSAVAFGVARIILLAECSNPYHPKAIRASGGSILAARLMEGPSIHDLPHNLPIVTLSPGGRNISAFHFPKSFGLVPGLEGPGLPEELRRGAVGIPISSEVESLNASAATAIALYAWAQSRRLTADSLGNVE